MFAIRGSVKGRQSVFRDDTYFVLDPAFGAIKEIPNWEGAFGQSGATLDEQFSEYTYDEATNRVFFPTGRRIYFNLPQRTDAFPGDIYESIVEGWTEADSGFKAVLGTKKDALYALLAVQNQPEFCEGAPSVLRCQHPLCNFTYPYCTLRSVGTFGEYPISWLPHPDFDFGNPVVTARPPRFRANINGTTLTVDDVVNEPGSVPLQVGMNITDGVELPVGTYYGNKLVKDTRITALGTGTGGNGTYTVNISQNWGTTRQYLTVRPTVIDFTRMPNTWPPPDDPVIGMKFTLAGVEGTYYVGTRQYLEIALAENNDPVGVPALASELRTDFFGRPVTERWLYRNTPNNPLLARVGMVTEVKRHLMLSNLGLSEFSAPNTPIYILDLSFNRLTYLNIEDCADLIDLDVQSNFLTDATFKVDRCGIDLSMISQRRPSLYGTTFGSIPPTTRYLRRVDLSFNQLTTATFSNYGVAESYKAANNKINTATFTHLFPSDVLNLSNQYPDSATQGLTSLAFPGGVFGGYRPREIDVSNNLLTSFDLGGTGIESKTEILKLADNNLGPAFVLPLPADQFTGYRLFRLDLSGNNLQTIDVQYGAPLLELDVSDNPLTSLVLPANTIKTYIGNRTYDYDPEADTDGDPITGEWWQFYNAYGPNVPMAFRHITGVQKLYARNTQLASFPTAGRRSIRLLDLRDNAALQSVTSAAVARSFITSNQWIEVQKGGVGFQAINIDQFTQANLTSGLKQNSVVVFRNLTFFGGPVAGGRFPVNGRPYLIHKAVRDTSLSASSSWSIIDRVSDITKWQPTGGDAPLTFDGNVLSINGQPFAGDGLTGGQMAIYEGDQWTHLSEVYLDNCPLLTTADFRGAPLLSKFSSNSAVTGTLFNAVPFSDGSWRGYSGHMSSLRVRNAGALTLAIAPIRKDSSGVSVMEEITVENVASLGSSVFYDFFATQFPVGVVCRSGVQVKSVGAVSVTVLAGILRTLGTWSFPSSLPGDSNVVDFSGTIATAGDTTTYNSSKTQAISRGWQVIDPTFV